MYSYKLNNSYTIYVNYAYLNECVKACRQREKISNTKKRAGQNSSTKRKNVVRVGSKVSVMNVETKKESVFTIVYSENIDVVNNHISETSPVGKAMVGHGVGETVELEVTFGLIKYKIIEVKWGVMMNNVRRKKIFKLKQELEQLKNNYSYDNLSRCIDVLTAIRDEEEYAFDSMPEGLQYSSRGMDSESAIDSMNNALEQLEEINQIEVYIEEAIDYLDEID